MLSAHRSALNLNLGRKTARPLRTSGCSRRGSGPPPPPHLRTFSSGGGDEEPRRRKNLLATLHTPSPFASAAAVAATGLSLSAAPSNCSAIDSGFTLPTSGFMASRSRGGVEVEVAVASLSPTALYLNKQASLAECCMPDTKWTSRDAVMFPLPIDHQGGRVRL